MIHTIKSSTGLTNMKQTFKDNNKKFKSLLISVIAWIIAFAILSTLFKAHPSSKPLLMAQIHIIFQNLFLVMVLCFLINIYVFHSKVANTLINKYNHSSEHLQNIIDSSVGKPKSIEMVKSFSDKFFIGKNHDKEINLYIDQSLIESPEQLNTMISSKQSDIEQLFGEKIYEKIIIYN